MPDQTEVLQWRGETVFDSSGSKIGKIDEIFVDAETERPEWAQVKLGGLTGGSPFMPLEGVSDRGGKITAPFSEDQVKHAPSPSADGELSQQDEAALYAHYGVTYSESRSDSGLAGGADTSTGRSSQSQSEGVVGDDLSGDETDSAMTRSEEELHVGTERREAGRARLRKYVVTEQVEKVVPVERETVHVEREPITDANIGDATSGPAISEEEHEVVLHEERAVVQKDVAAKERVRLDKAVVTDQQSVSEEVRKEQIDLIDGEGQPREGIDGVRGTDDGV